MIDGKKDVPQGQTSAVRPFVGGSLCPGKLSHWRMGRAKADPSDPGAALQRLLLLGSLFPADPGGNPGGLEAVPGLTGERWNDCG